MVIISLPGYATNVLSGVKLARILSIAGLAKVVITKPRKTLATHVGPTCLDV